jgi:hypothetical protein
MNRIIRLSLALGLALWLAACAQMTAPNTGRDYLPGGAAFYSAGSAQNKGYFMKHVKRVQSDYSLYSGQRHWGDDGPNPAPAHLNRLQIYYPLHVRWELKDGRQFIAENINVRAIMQDYFKTHAIQLQWQREGRQRDSVGDFDPSLVFEVREDEVILKWLITINHTPVNERLTSTGAAAQWKFSKEQHVVGSVKGTRTQGIDFDKHWEVSK